MFPITFMSTLYYALINRITFRLITSHKWELNHVNPPAKTHSPHSVNYSDWTSHFEPRVAKFLCGSGSCIIIHKSVCFTCMLFPINFQCTFIRNNWEESTYIYICDPLFDVAIYVVPRAKLYISTTDRSRVDDRWWSYGSRVINISS